MCVSLPLLYLNALQIRFTLETLIIYELSEKCIFIPLVQR